jgi:putative oxidoreductase
MSLSANTHRRVLWTVRLLLAVAFGAAGAAKLAGAAPMVHVFDLIGVGQWFRYVTGIVEITGAILMLAPRTGLLAGLLLFATMACAVVTHLFVIGGNPVPAIVLGLLSAFVAYRTRPTGRVVALSGAAL